MQLMYIFDAWLLDENQGLTDPTDVKMKDHFGKLWTNFIMTG